MFPTTRQSPAGARLSQARPRQTKAELLLARQKSWPRAYTGPSSIAAPPRRNPESVWLRGTTASPPEVNEAYS